MKENMKMEKKELSFMKKKGAPKSMIKHEQAEIKSMKGEKMACGGKVKAYAKGGAIDGCAVRGKTKAKMVKM